VAGGAVSSPLPHAGVCAEARCCVQGSPRAWRTAGKEPQACSCDQRCTVSQRAILFSQALGELPGGSLIAKGGRHATQSSTVSVTGRRLDDLKATLAVPLSVVSTAVCCLYVNSLVKTSIYKLVARKTLHGVHDMHVVHLQPVKYGDLQLQKCEIYARAGSPSCSEISSKLVTARTACEICCQQRSDVSNLSIVYQGSVLHQSAHTEVQHGDVTLTRIAAVSAQYCCRAEVQSHGAAASLSPDRSCAAMQSQSSWRTAASRCTSWHDESHSTAGRSAFSAARQPTAGERALVIIHYSLRCCHVGDRAGSFYSTSMACGCS
jgi:hypothetical protein